MKVENKIYSSIYGLKKLEPSARADRNPNGGGSVNVRNKSFSQLQSELAEKRDLSGFQSKLDPRIAVALTSANSDQLFSVKGRKDGDKAADIIHDHSYNRGKSTNIEI